MAALLLFITFLLHGPSLANLVDLPDDVLIEILARVPDDRILVQCSLTCRKLRDASAATLRFRQLVQTFARYPKDVPNLSVMDLVLHDFHLPSLDTTIISSDLVGEINKFAHRSRVFQSPEIEAQIDLIRKKYPEDLRNLFPSLNYVAAQLLKRSLNVPVFRCPHRLRALHRYGIQFDTHSYIKRVGVPENFLPDIYPLLRPTRGSVHFDFPLIDALFIQPDPDRVKKLLDIPEFYLRLRSNIVGFIIMLEKPLRDKTMSLDALLTFPLLPEILHQQLGNGQTLLHLAFTYGRMDLVERLLQLGADPATCDAFGFTPIRCLSPDVKSVASFFELLPRFPQLDQTLRENWSHFVSVLNAALRESSEVARLALAVPFAAEFVNVPGFKLPLRLIHSVFKYGRLELVPHMLRIPNFDLDVKDWDGVGLIMYLPNDHLPQFINLLQLKPVRQLLQCNYPDFVEKLGSLMIGEDMSIVDIVMREDWFPDIVNVVCTKNGQSLLHYAAYHNRLNIVRKLLMQPNINTNLCDNRGKRFDHFLTLFQQIFVLTVSGSFRALSIKLSMCLMG